MQNLNFFFKFFGKKEMKNLDEILELPPQAFTDLGINHYSPTQLNSSVALWAYKYAVLTSAERRKLRSTFKMFLGTTIGDICQLNFCDEIYTFDTGEYVPNKKKTSKTKGDDVLGMAIEKYEPWDDDDKKYYDNVKSAAQEMYNNAYNGWKSMSMQSPVVGENTVKMKFNYVFCEGRTDGEDKLKLLEQKMKCPGLNKVKKDGTQSVRTNPLPKDEPDINHARQTAFYHFATGKRPFILYANEKEYKIFDSANCERLTKDGMQESLQHYKRMAAIRDRAIMRSNGVINDLLKDLDPDWQHNYEWKIGDEWLQHAQETYKEAQK